MKVSIGWNYHTVIEQSQIELALVFLLFCLIWANKLNHSALKCLRSWSARCFRSSSLEAELELEFCPSDLLGEYSPEKDSGGSRMGQGEARQESSEEWMTPNWSCLEMRELAFWTPGPAGVGWGPGGETTPTGREELPILHPHPIECKLSAISHSSYRMGERGKGDLGRITTAYIAGNNNIYLRNTALAK